MAGSTVVYSIQSIAIVSNTSIIVIASRMSQYQKSTKPSLTTSPPLPPLPPVRPRPYDTDQRRVKRNDKVRLTMEYSTTARLVPGSRSPLSGARDIAVPPSGLGSAKRVSDQRENDGFSRMGGSSPVGKHAAANSEYVVAPSSRLRGS
jgi:hypothetical protein